MYNLCGFYDAVVTRKSGKTKESTGAYYELHNGSDVNNILRVYTAVDRSKYIKDTRVWINHINELLLMLQYLHLHPALYQKDYFLYLQ